MTSAIALLFACVLSASQPAQATGENMTRTASFTLHLKGSSAQTFPLFDPVNETKWDPQWKPHLLNERVEEGLVFVVGQGDSQTTWMMDRYDPATMSVGYVYFSKAVITRIRIAVAPAGKSQSTATVVYTRTALTPEGVHVVEGFPEHFASERPQWENAINNYLLSLPK
jgi:hypothetical protein